MINAAIIYAAISQRTRVLIGRFALRAFMGYVPPHIGHTKLFVLVCNLIGALGCMRASTPTGSAFREGGEAGKWPCRTGLTGLRATGGVSEEQPRALWAGKRPARSTARLVVLVDLVVIIHGFVHRLFCYGHHGA